AARHGCAGLPTADFRRSSAGSVRADPGLPLRAAFYWRWRRRRRAQSEAPCDFAPLPLWLTAPAAAAHGHRDRAAARAIFIGDRASSFAPAVGGGPPPLK